MRTAGSGLLALAALAALLALPSPLRAEDVIRLKSGIVLRGRIVAETDASVTIEVQPSVRVSYSRGQIASIVRDPSPPAPAPPADPKAPKPAPCSSPAPAVAAPPPPADVPQGPMADLVVRVGPGGVPRRLPPVGLMPRRDFEFYLRRVAVPLRKSPEQMTADERKRALDLAIRDDLRRRFPVLIRVTD